MPTGMDLMLVELPAFRKELSKHMMGLVEFQRRRNRRIRLMRRSGLPLAMMPVGLTI